VILRRLFLATLALAICVGCANGRAAPAVIKLRTEALEIVTAKGVARLTVEIADTDATRERGLMYRTSLKPNAGMLFDFKTPQAVAFWMRNTLIPLDMLFIDKDGLIINIAEQARPLDETPIPSRGVVLGVLEIAGGRAAELGVEPGDRVKQRIFRGR
jgi:hypothetical protein